MILARIIADEVGSARPGRRGPRRALFDPLGITTVAHDLDGIGTMSGGSNINMSAQDFARFGLLYLRGGGLGRPSAAAAGAWVDAGRLPAPTHRRTAPTGGSTTAPAANGWRSAADGFAGQVIVVVPSLDLVVVALATPRTAVRRRRRGARRGVRPGAGMARGAGIRRRAGARSPTAARSRRVP